MFVLNYDETEVGGTEKKPVEQGRNKHKELKNPHRCHDNTLGSSKVMEVVGPCKTQSPHHVTSLSHFLNKL